MSIETTIAAIERDSGGQISAALYDFQSGDTIGYHADRPVKTASVIKLPILVHVALCVAEGSLRWDMPLRLTDAEKVGGMGVLREMSDGVTLPLRDVCYLMTAISDNTATNMLIEQIGIEPINRRIRALGLERTTLLRKAFSPDTPASLPYGLGVTTASEIVGLLRMIADDRIGDHAAAAEVLRLLALQQDVHAMPRYLPHDWRYAGKTGRLDDLRNDAGIVTAPDGRRWALALFCQELPQIVPTADNPALIAIARLARALLLDRDD